MKIKLSLLLFLLVLSLPGFALAQEPGDPREPALYGTWTSTPSGLSNSHNLAVRPQSVNSGVGIVVTFPQQANPLAPYMDWKNLRMVRLQALADALSRKINFDFDSSELEDAAFPIIKEVATILKENPDIGLHLGGHTDLMGSEQYNDGLSAQRAHTVESVLLAQGISADRLFVAVHGETMPLIRTETKERENRRVEFAVVDLFTR